MISNESDKDNIQSLISCCFVTAADKNLLIICPNDAVWRALVKNYKHILALMSCESSVTCMTIATGERRVSFPLNPSYRLHLPMSNKQDQKIIHPDQPESDSPSIIFDDRDLRSRILAEREDEIIAEVMGYGNAAYIIGLLDDKGIFSNSRIHASSGIDPNKWVGNRLTKLWIDNELPKFKETLLKDINVSNYSYYAHLFTGQKARFTVDARLTYFRGDPVRIVKTLACEPMI
jgi:hypothetical protein